LALTSTSNKTTRAPGDRSRLRHEDSGIARELLTADEVAAMLGMGVDWVWEQARKGRIPHVKLGRYRRFRRPAILAWLEQMEQRESSR
jgi:excisionase family DNA binding protein